MVDSVGATLAAGTYDATITVSVVGDPSEYVVINVHLIVEPEEGIAVMPQDLVFNASVVGGSPPAQTMSITCRATAGVDWVVGDDASWLLLDAVSGLCTSEVDQVHAYVDSTGLAIGSYEATVTVADSLAVLPSATVYVRLDVTEDAVWAAPNGSDFDGDGSCGQPYRSASKAARMVSKGQSIILKPGSYDDAFAVAANDVTLRGVTDPGDTIIEGMTYYEVVDVEDRANITISNLTIRGGATAVRTVNAQDLLVTSCVLEQSTDTALLLDETDGVEVLGNLFLDCSTAVTFDNSGDVDLVVVADNLILDSTGDAVVVTGNNNPCNMKFVNNTIVGAAWAGIETSYFTYGFVIANNIIWNNTVGVRANAYDTSTWVNNNVYGNTTDWDDPADDASGTNGNIAVAPLFVDPASEDYRLSAGSGCREAGTNTHVSTTEDYSGAQRIVDGDGDTAATVDIGCYEWQVTDP